MTQETNETGVQFVYDGACPICRLGATVFEPKKSIGPLDLVDARAACTPQRLAEVNKRGFDLDKGMVVVDRGRYYHGADALHHIAKIGASHGPLTRFIYPLFRSKSISRFAYPFLRWGRAFALWLNGVDRLDNLTERPREIILKSVLGADWDKLPTILKRRYQVRAYSDDRVAVEGVLDVKISPLMSVLSRLSGMLIAHSEKAVSVRVDFYSGPASKSLHFDRVFRFNNHRTVRFHSRMEPVGENEMIEFMSFGVGWRFACAWRGDRLVLSHRGFVWRLFGRDIPVPLGLVIGRGAAEEIPNGAGFDMWTYTDHPLFGKGMSYSGRFEMADL